MNETIDLSRVTWVQIGGEGHDVEPGSLEPAALELPGAVGMVQASGYRWTAPGGETRFSLAPLEVIVLPAR
jgi:hypothetical protein